MEQGSDLIARTATRIRRNLKTRTDSEAVAAYSMLWALEAAQDKSEEQAENVTRMKQDVARLLAPEVPRTAVWRSTLASTSDIQDGVDEYPAAARRELAERYPYSDAAITEAFVKARGPNPYPDKRSPEQVAAFWRKEWQSALPVARRFPRLIVHSGHRRRQCSRDPAASSSQIHDAIVVFLASAKADPDGMRTRPPQPIEIAQILAERGILDDIPELVSAGFSAIKREFSPENANDVLGGSAADLRGSRDQMNLWGFNALCEANIRLGRIATVKDLLLQQEDVLNRIRPSSATPAAEKFGFAEEEALFWYLKGLFAEAEQRKADALIDYRNSISTFPPRRPSPDRRDQVMQLAQRLWKGLGGTAQGWNDWAAHSSLTDFDAGSGSTNAWTKLPPR